MTLLEKIGRLNPEGLREVEHLVDELLVPGTTGMVAPRADDLLAQIRAVRVNPGADAPDPVEVIRRMRDEG